jgi:hypothetical protein
MSTVSWESGLLVPMIPCGPRLIQPTTYSPSTGRPVEGSMIRPCSLGITARMASKGIPGRGTPWYPIARKTRPSGRVVTRSVARGRIEPSSLS